MSRSEDRKRLRSDDFSSLRGSSSNSRSRSRSRERVPRRNNSRPNTPSEETSSRPHAHSHWESHARPTQPATTHAPNAIPITTTSTVHPKQQSMAAIVDAPVEQVAAQPPPQHIQYNIDETTLRKFCQPYNMEELVSMLRATAYVNKEFYQILVDEMKCSSKWCKLFVHGLPWTTTQETLYNAFSRFGQIQECVILKDRNGQSKGYGFINYSNAQEAINAINAGPQQIDGRMVGSDLAWKGRKNRAAHNANHAMHKKAPAAHGYAPHNTRNMHTSNALGGPLAMRRLFVYSLLYTTTDETLHAVFSQYGELEEAVIIKDKNNEMKSKGYGFVIYKNVCDAQKALQQPDKIIDGRTVHCSLAIEGQNHHNKNKNIAQNNHLLHSQTLQIAPPPNTTLTALSAALQLQQQQALQPTLQTYDPYQNVLYGNLSAATSAVNTANPTQLLQQLLAQQIQQQQILNAQQQNGNESLQAKKTGNVAPAPINPNGFA